MDSLLTEQHRLLRQSVRQFAETELGPIAREIDDAQHFPMEAYRKAGQMGLIGVLVPQEYGGAGGDLMSAGLIKEELCRVAAGFAISYSVCALNFCHFLSLLGTEEQKRQWLPAVISGEKLGCFCLTEPDAGSDALSLKTRAESLGNGYRLNGSKIFITNAPLADYFLVVARTSEGKSSRSGTTFLAEKGTPGLSVSKKADKLGMRCSPTGEVFFESMIVPNNQILGEIGGGFLNMFRILEAERALQALTSLGIAQAAYEAAVKYAKERVQFDQPIANFQLIREKLANMCIGLETARLYAYNTILAVDRGVKGVKETAISAVYAGRVAMEIVVDAVQIHGGYGFLKEYNVERYYRDAKLGEIGGGTTQIKQMIIARETLKG